MPDSWITLRGRAGAHALHSRHDSRELTAKGRAAFLQKFIDQVDPDRSLPEAERLRRAEHALRSHMAKLALRSAIARKKAARDSTGSTMEPIEPVSGSNATQPGDEAA